MRFSDYIKDKTILNIGCWIGWYEKIAVRKGCKFIVGIDTDLKSLEKAKYSVNKAHFLLASALNLPFKSRYFDIVTMFDVIEHLPPDTEVDVLKEISRALKDGKIILSTPNNNLLSNALDPAWFFDHRHYKPSQLSKFLKKAGFEIEKIIYGGSVAELISMIFLYIFKTFNMEIPFKKSSDILRDREYSRENFGFVTLFIKARKL